MAVVYGESQFPTTEDYTLDLDHLIAFFGLKHKAFLKHPTNKYLLSWNNDFLTIVPIRDRYRIIGRSTHFTPIARRKDYDVFFVGTAQECIQKFTDFVRDFGLLV